MTRPHLGYTTLNRILDAILPPRCPVTGTLVGAQGTIAPNFWARLTFIHTPFCATCGIPFPHDVAQGMVCGDCLQVTPVFDRARAAVRYDDASAAALLKLKYADATVLAPVFAQWLHRAGEEFLTPDAVFLSVPLHRRRLLWRRYNQAALLADALSKKTGLPHWPLALRRVRPTESQGRKTRAQREENLRQAFAVDRAYAEKLKNKTIILIDDVFTSGATVSACAKILKYAEVKTVNVLTVARVVRN